MATRLLLLLSFITIAHWQSFGQCNVTATVSPTNTVCGDCATLTAFGQGQGQQVFSENFNSGSPSGWGYTQQATYTNPCSPGGVDGTKHLWMGNQSGVPRALETVSYNFSTATSGVTVCFDMLFAKQGNSAPCEGPDEPDEGVAIQYSTNGGSTWTTIHYFDPNGGNDPNLVNWKNWCFQLPPGAITSNVKIRWFQDADSGADYDHWGIDNVAIYFNDPTYVITWTHDNYSYAQGSSGGPNPNKVCPRTTTDYYVRMTNGTTTCRDTVRVTVANPTITINAGNDTSICPGTCANINAVAKVVKSPAKTPTYSNTQIESIQTGLGGTTNVNINVQGLNMTNVLPNSITRVCITGLTFFGFNIFPPGQQTVGNLEIRLVCPDGTKILLVPSGVTTSTAAQGYTQTCFTVSGGNIASGSPPYTGQFAPNQPFNNLAGCTANGLWSIEVKSTSALSFGTGFFNGWSITFDDPEISYPANFTWSPTTNMTGSNTLTPRVCPSNTTTYTLTASDTAGCITVNDQVVVTVQPNCCNLAFTSTKTNPTCGASNGSITMNVTNGTGPYTYTWAPGGVLGASRTGLPAGSYTVTITDNGQANCQKDTTIVLTTTTAPVINSITPTPEPCAGDNNGSVAVNASGGTGTLTYTWSPAGPNSATRTGLAPGNYVVTVTDASGCTATANTTLNAGPVCCTLAFTSSKTNPTCGGTNGSITITVTAGGGTYTYAWSGGGSSTNTLSGIGSGSYTVTITDVVQGCTKDTTIVLASANAPTVSNITSTAQSCQGLSDGTATVTATGGTGTLTYAWNTTPAQNTATATGLAPGPYTVTVTDGAGCQAVANISVAAGPNCCNITYTIAPTHPACGTSNGAVTITNPGFAGYGYAWGGGQTSQSLASQPAGTYTVTITDARYPNCQRDTTITLTNPNAPTISSIVPTAETCLGAGDGSIDLTVTGGTGGYTYLWGAPSGATTEDISSLAPGLYSVTVTDASNCQVTGSATVAAGPNCCNLSFGLTFTNPTCGASNGSIEVDNIVSTGVPTFVWSNGPVTAQNNGIPAGTYTVTVTDPGQPNCQKDSTLTIANPNAATISSITATPETCAGDADGTATVVATGGAAPLGYSWSTTPAQNSATATGLAPATYTVSVTDANGCVVTGQVTVNAGPVCCSLTATSATTPASCAGTDGTITITVDPTSGTAPFEYNIDGGAFGSSNTFTVAGGNYTVIARDANNCTVTLPVTVTEANNTIVLSLTGTDPSCPGSADGEVAANITGGNQPLSIVWNNGEITPGITGLVAGTYSVTVTDHTNCSAFGTTTINDPLPLVVNLGNDVNLCDGQNVVLDAGLAGAYVWSSGDTTQSLTVTTSGNYSVTITNNGGCTATDDVVVDVASPITVDAGEDTTIIQYESIIQLNGLANGGVTGGSYVWTPDDFLSCDNCTNPTLSPDSTTLYVLTYTDSRGCTASDTVLITVEPGEYLAIVPNAFSPNGDGANDILYVYHKGVKRLVWQIHNRWGEKVFETDDKNVGWNGTHKGVAAQDGVYVWSLYVEFLNVKIPAQRSKGSVLLLK